MAIFLGARQDKRGLTLRFGNDESACDIELMGMNMLSLKAMKRLAELTGSNCETEELLEALTL
jgi:hypothetical protein